ncbi:signal transduction histidine kinase [Paenarthrobacter nicotinovorans]|uniref:Oxygen sensor histidine kinase NreB n=1 Tax=Paenarthrobacter nicotinovorans TaxID=29320 RepID=A0ABV0GR78_PAENI|nr:MULTISPECIES: sensor histidine kinase [Micrococcaceae]MDR6438347.1 signal transduction histidine kinase [Paenarthrobacter nicotinovorans]SCZ64475.1 Signal transduction histidine kinase [Arthrobacter sp. UNCCL28]
MQTTGAATILRVLRVSLHVGFAVLLLVAVVRLLAGVGTAGAPSSVAIAAGLGLSAVLALVYLAGTVLEKRYAGDAGRFNPTPYARWWLGAVMLLWLLLLLVSGDFAWVAFPLFFLQLHLLPRRLALPAIALSTALLVGALWFHSRDSVDGGLQPAMVLGPVFGAVFAVVTGLAYRALFLEAENQRTVADDLRRTRAELAQTQHDAGMLAERERLAREIHDTLAQGFSSIVLMGRSAEKALDDGDTSVAKERLKMVQDTASGNLAEARSFVRGLRSPDLEQSGLVDTLRRLCEKTETEAAARGTSLRCRFELVGTPVELPNTFQTTLLRAAQASLANVWAHAQASTAVVTLSFPGTEVTLDVFDDGVGFESSTAAGTARGDGTGVGLMSLRERLAALDGSLEVESAPGEGTVVAVRVPLPAEEGAS